MTEAEIRTEIAQLEVMLFSGATSASSDGESVSFNAEEAHSRLRELRAMLPGQAHQRRRVRTLSLRNAFGGGVE